MATSRLDELMTVCRQLSEEGQTGVMKKAAEIYMREQRITEEDLQRLPPGSGITREEVDAAHDVLPESQTIH